MERLQKYLARAGISSRRAAEQLILDGRVKVNGQVVTTLGTKVDASKDLIVMDGAPVVASNERQWYLFYKPPGVVTTMHDPQGRPTVGEYVDRLEGRVFPVGRLDYDAEGALLLTDDGETANKLMHPKHQVPRVYLAKVKGSPDDASLEKLRGGVRLEDGLATPTEVSRFEKAEKNTWIKIVVTEGRPHLVKRLFAAIGHPVVRLYRPQHAGIGVEGVKPGEFRALTVEEVRLVKAAGDGRGSVPNELRLPARRHGHGAGSDDSPARAPGRAPSEPAEGDDRSAAASDESESESGDGETSRAPRSRSPGEGRSGLKSRRDVGGSSPRGGEEERGHGSLEGSSGGGSPSGGFKARAGLKGEGGSASRGSGGAERGGFKSRAGSDDERGGFKSRAGSSDERGGFKSRAGSSDERGGFRSRAGSSDERGGFKSRAGSRSEGGEGRGGFTSRAGSGSGFAARSGSAAGAFKSRGTGFGSRSASDDRGGFKPRASAGGEGQRGALKSRGESDESAPFSKRGGANSVGGKDNGFRGRSATGDEGGGSFDDRPRDTGFRGRSSTGDEGGGSFDTSRSPRAAGERGSVHRGTTAGSRPAPNAGGYRGAGVATGSDPFSARTNRIPGAFGNKSKGSSSDGERRGPPRSGGKGGARGGSRGGKGGARGGR